MSARSYRVKELARLAKVTVRTLHHYDDIGLLAPSERTSAGYRVYRDGDLLRLQQVLIYRELGLPLEEIRRILDDPGFDTGRALREQREQLSARVRETEAMIRSVDAALAAIEGENAMDLEKIFEGFDPEEHAEEVESRWGETPAFKESRRRTRGYGAGDWERIRAEDRELMAAAAEKLAAGAAPSDPDVVEIAERHRLHIDRWFYPCGRAMHARLADLYTGDSRFTAAFDRHGEGLARFFAAAIRENAARD